MRDKDERRAPTKGAMAAERASAGLGTSDDYEGSLLLRAPSPGVDTWPKRVPKGPQPQKSARRS
jgi:hypothetical protein